MRKAIDWNAVKAQLNHAQESIDAALSADPQRIAAVYSQRAAQLAARQSGKDSANGAVHLLRFQLGAERFALELAEISEVLAVGNVTPIPGAEAEIFGATNVRGEIIPLINLARVLNVSTEAGPAGSYVLILKRNQAGLLVGSLDQIMRLLPAQISTAKEVISEKYKQFFNGIAPDATLVLCADALLAHPVFAVN